MRSILRTALICSALGLAASSCASRVQTLPTFPPAADIQPAAEPAYPLAALDPCPTNNRSDACPAEDAEQAWWNSVLIWGRGEHAKVVRVCNWAKDLKMTLPAGYCSS